MKKILVVDDDPDIVDLIRIRLEANRYQVVSASNGADGVSKAESEMPDLIIMDIMMPSMMGGEAVRKIKANPRTSQIPLLFLTAVMANMPNVSEERKVNVDGQFYNALAKPFNAEQLLFEIRKLLNQPISPARS